MSWWSEFASRIEHDAPIGRHTWYRLGGPARHLFHPRSAEDLSELMRRAGDEGLELKVLGGGANVLIHDDGFDGVVVRLDDDAFRSVERKGTTVEAGAGVDLMPFARHLSEQGLTGLERMAGIPGTIGGALRMNAGGRHGEFGDIVRSVRLVNRDGEIETWSPTRVGFAYRRTALGDRIVLSVEIELGEGDPVRVARVFRDHLESKRKAQPMADRTAGCVFKNPPGESAGALIDRAGLKGARSGRAVVSHQHANFIVAEEGATATDVLRLIDLIRDRVITEFGTELDIEIDVW
ncbi:MAG: UDP-N-acetylmuramate dehydrogenase [Phycisphaerae bacterium]|jgi:UDP-N-acetylmuramate dehydrogenase